MTTRQRIEAVLRGELPDRVPMTIYYSMLPRSQIERELRNRGLGFSWRTGVVGWEYPNCSVESHSYSNKDGSFSRTTWRTPVGEVYSISRQGGALSYGTSWTVEWPVKSRDDYRVMEFIANDAKPVPAYDGFLETQRLVGEDGYVLSHVGYSPLMEMIVGLIGFDQFSFHMADHADAFWSLYDMLSRKMRRSYPLFAKSPAHVVLYGGNVHPEVMGLERFEKYVLPRYEELAALLHEEGKLLGVHLDADNQLFKHAVAKSGIDVVEAFTPPPDCDLSVREAREVWPRKILWINFPSSLHLASPEVIRGTTEQLLLEAAPGDRFIIGVTEDIPADRWAVSLNEILEVVEQKGNTPISSSHTAGRPRT